MSDLIKTFLFYDRQADKPIFVKRSRDIDYSFDGPDFYSVETAAAAPITASENGLLKRKVAVAIWLRTIMAVIDRGVSDDFSERSLKAIPVDDASRSKFLKLTAEEKQLLKERILLNRKRFEQKILAAKTIEEVESEFLMMRNSVQIGIYSPIERELRKIYEDY